MQKVIAPKLDLQTTEVEIIKWLKHDGDRVTQGEVILEIATEKATVGIEAPETGVLRGISYGEGIRVKVGETLAFIAGENERIVVEEEAARSSGLPETLPASQTAPTGAAGEAPSAAPGKPESVRSTPAARQLCKRSSVTIEEVFRALAREPVTEKEVKEYLASRSRPQIDSFEEVPLSYRRKIIARRMQDSARTIPHIHLFAEVIVDELERQKAELIRSGTRITLTDLFLRHLGQVLFEFPSFNATYVEQKGEPALRKYRQVNIGLAVSTAHGLVVPVLRDVSNKPLDRIVREKVELIARARDNRLSPEDLAGATFTLSNLGNFQVTHFTALINPPQVAILSIGRASERFQPVKGRPQRVRVAAICLGLDHRALDGTDGARFISRFKELVEASTGDSA